MSSEFNKSQFTCSSSDLTYKPEIIPLNFISNVHGYYARILESCYSCNLDDINFTHSVSCHYEHLTFSVKVNLIQSLTVPDFVETIVTN